MAGGRQEEEEEEEKRMSGQDKRTSAIKHWLLMSGPFQKKKETLLLRETEGGPITFMNGDCAMFSPKDSTPA